MLSLQLLAITLAALRQFPVVNGAAMEAMTDASLERTWATELDGGKPVSPIKRVVKLLKQMQEQLQKEATNEVEMYDKMVCYCETTQKEKAQAIEDANTKERSLEAEIQERAARYGELKATIERAKETLATEGECLAEARAIREKEKQAFEEAETEMIASIESLKSAIQVLSKHHESSFLQEGTAEVSALRAVLRDVSVRYELLQASGRGVVAPRRGRVSLLSVSSQSTASETDKLLLSALDPRGAAVSDALPVKFAMQLLQNAAAQQQTQRRSQTAVGFLQAGQDGPYASYSPQSSQIYGILQQLQEDFEANLEEQRRDEKRAAEAFAQLASAKGDEVSVGKEKLDAMEMEHADNQKALADAKEDLKLTRNTRSKVLAPSPETMEEIEFARSLKLKCQNLDKDWEKRQKTRSAEVQAVSEALEIITKDEHAEVLHGSVAFLQERTTSKAGAYRSLKAAALLRQAADSPDFAADDLLSAWQGRTAAVSSPKAELSTLALAVQLDSFTKVKEMMDKMVADLKAEQAEEVKFKAFCQKELAENEREAKAKTGEKEEHEALIEELASSIAKLKKDIEAAKRTIDETTLGVKKAGETREEENEEYQTVLKDQRATQSILKKVLGKLQKFYKKQEAVGLAQLHAEEDPDKVLEFTKYAKNKGASPVMGLIAQIIEDSANVEAEAVEDEKAAQAAYEVFVRDSNAVVKELKTAVAEKTKVLSSSEMDLEDAKEDQSNAAKELELLDSNAEDLHKECDFVLKNFDTRQKARAQELESIHAAKAILSGAK